MHENDPQENWQVVETLVVPRTSDLGDGFTVRRALPSAQRRMVGPFVFLDEMGPVRFEAGKGLDVRPHPHIGLATVTYLFEGEILHRDSLGTCLPIRPGELNWMTAGRGIVHSERTPPEARATSPQLAGLQCWVALPESHEETEPGFVHFGRSELPTFADEGIQGRVIVGSLHGLCSPVQTHSSILYVEITLAPGARINIAADYEERGFYLVRGHVDLGSDGVFGPNQLIVLKPRTAIDIRATSDGPVHLMLLGGEAMSKPRHIWWNFVSSSRERIEQAKVDWAEGKFPAVPGETEFIPLPGPRPGTVEYP